MIEYLNWWSQSLPHVVLGLVLHIGTLILILETIQDFAPCTSNRPSDKD